MSAILYTAHVWQVGSVLWGDSHYYYAYTRSLVMDWDIDFTNEMYELDAAFPHIPEVSEITGRVTNKFSIGTALMWIPGFIVGQLLSYIVVLFTPGLGISVLHEVMGYGFITQYVVGLSGVLMSVAGLYILYLSLEKCYGSFIDTAKRRNQLSLGLVLLFFLTTHIFFYTAIDPLNSHSTSFLLSSALLYITVRILKKEIGGYVHLFVGALAGMLFLVRNQDVLVAVPLFLHQVSSAFISLKKNQRWSQFLESMRRLASMAGFVTGAVLLQQAVVWYLFGQFGSPYLLRGETLSWIRPDFIRVLFSPGNGLFFFAPITLICLWGLWKQGRNGDTLGVMSLGVFALQLYVIASWGREILGGPYGSRMFVSSLPWLAVGLVPVVESWQKRPRWRTEAGVVFTALAVNNVVQTAIMLIRY